MYPYTFSISLRIRHPKIDLSYLGSLLGLLPDRIWKAGEARATPRGTPLEGKNKDSYWCARLTGDREKSEICSLEDSLADWTGKLSAYHTEFRRLLAEGGKVEYFVWIFCEQNLGFELDHKLLRDIANLGITLGIVCDP
jgi:hypothetical protein